MLAYNIPHFAAGDIETFLISVARAQGRIRKVIYLITDLLLHIHSS